MTTNHPARALGYNLTAYLANSALNLAPVRRSRTTVMSCIHLPIRCWDRGRESEGHRQRRNYQSLLRHHIPKHRFRRLHRILKLLRCKWNLSIPVSDTQMTCASVIDQIMLSDELSVCLDRRATASGCRLFELKITGLVVPSNDGFRQVSSNTLVLRTPTLVPANLVLTFFKDCVCGM